MIDIRFVSPRAVSAALIGLGLMCATVSRAQVHEYEGFDYTGTALDGQNGGTGWGVNAWQDPSGFATLSDDDVSLNYPVSVSFAPVGSRVNVGFTGDAQPEIGAPGPERRLGVEMPLNAEGNTYYVSCLVRRHGAFRIELVRDQAAGGHVRWRFGGAASTNATQDAILGVSGDNTFAGIFPTNETVYLVTKMLTHQPANDEVFMNIYRSGDVLPAAEPATWQASASGGSTVVHTRLRIRNHENLPLEIDEIRIGTSWLDVVGPLLAGAPQVITQPASVTNLYEGFGATFLVEATGELPLSYQWYKDGTPLPNETNAVLQVATANIADQGTYRVRITNPSGMTDSDPVSLVVLNPSTDLNVGLRAKWPFDQATGLTAPDVSGNGNNGTLVNFAGDDSQWIPSFAPSLFGNALAFGGSNYVEVLDPTLNLGNQYVNGFTLATWFKSNVPLGGGTGAGARMFEKDNSIFLLQGVGDGAMNTLVKKGGANITAAIGQALDANRWYHYVAWYNGAELRVYLDGQQVASTPVAAPIDVGGNFLRIGADEAGTGTRYLNGDMDEVGFWERPLSESEILELAARFGPPNVIDQPLSQEKFEGGTVVFRANAVGAAPLRYLWYHGDNEIRSATSNVFTLVNISMDQAGEYRVRVSNDEGTNFSDAVTLTVLPVTSIADGAEALWKFDENSGLVAQDSSTHDRDGQLMDFEGTDAQWITGQVGGALAFDGESNRVVAAEGQNIDLNSDSTFAFWVRLNTYGTVVDHGNYLSHWSRILRKGTYFDVQAVDNPGGVRATILMNGVPAPQNILELNEWQHFAIVFSGGMVTFYKNGFQVGEPVPASLGTTNTDAIVLGSSAPTGAATNWLDGALDEVGIWTRPLREFEILELAGRDVAGPPVIVTQPVSISRYAGGTASFLVQATGKRPLTYTWQHDGVPVPDSNTNHLVITNVTVADAGSYIVTVQNEFHSVMSTPATLVVQAITNVATGLIAYYPMDETEGTVLNDATGRGHDAALPNSTAGATLGIIGGAQDFDGIDDLAIVAHHPELDIYNQLTISLWIQPRTLAQPNTGGLGRMVRKDINYDFTTSDFNLDGMGTLRVYGDNKVIYDAPGDPLTVNEWQHVAVVYKNGTFQFFRNGRALAEPIPGLLGPPVTNDLIIGNFQPDWQAINRPFNGYMDDLGIWDRALSPAELDGIYQNGLAGKPLDAPFEPLEIRDIAIPAPGQVRLVFYSPFTGRDHGVEWKNHLEDADWMEQTGVTFTALADDLIEAVFAQPVASSAFYRISLLPQAAIFFEDFETGGPGWTHGGVNDIWEIGVPVNGPGMAVSGTNVAATSLTGNIVEFSDDYLRSPPIDLTGLSRATLSFSEWRNVDPDPTFHGTIVNVLDAGTQAVLQQLWLAAGSTTGYEERVLPLPTSVLGRNVIIEFRLYCDGFNLLEGWYIDDVEIVPE